MPFSSGLPFLLCSSCSVLSLTDGVRTDGQAWILECIWLSSKSERERARKQNAREKMRRIIVESNGTVIPPARRNKWTAQVAEANTSHAATIPFFFSNFVPFVREGERFKTRINYGRVLYST